MIDDRSNTKRAWTDLLHGSGLDRLMGGVWMLSLLGYAALAIIAIWVVLP